MKSRVDVKIVLLSIGVIINDPEKEEERKKREREREEEMVIQNEWFTHTV